jgi:hypothetical protein
VGITTTVEVWARTVGARRRMRRGWGMVVVKSIVL